MEGDTEKSLPVQLYGTSSLCFDKDDFMKDDFSVDNFVRVHQAAGSGGLETLRDDLGVYLKILRSAMIELINRDYADFVNLSTNLTGLDRLIEALRTPLEQLREEVLSVEKLLDDAISTISKDLDRRRTLTKQKALLHRLGQISTRLERLEALLKSGTGGSSGGSDGAEDGCPGETDLVDRLASEVNHLNFLVSHCEGAALLKVFKPRVAEVCQFVERGLERGLREGVLNKDLGLLRRTLRTYASLGSTAHAHTLIRHLIRKELAEVISDSSLRSDPRGLPGMYTNTLTAVNTICQPLLAVTAGPGPDAVRGYSFLERSAWPEIVTSLETNTQHIFNPGNPASFHQRYLETQEFLESFERLLETRERVEAFRETSDYNTFLDLWNLPVYFQIRYQEIGHMVERSLVEEEEEVVMVEATRRDEGSEATTEFTFTCSAVVWKSLRRCYSLEVFLPPLLHRFWKLMLLVLARYRTWVTNTTAALKAPGQQQLQTTRETSTKSRDLGNTGGGNSSTDKPSTRPREKSALDQGTTTSSQKRDAAVGLVHDIKTMSQKLPTLFTDSIQPLVSHLPPEKLMLIKEELSEQSHSLVGQVPSIGEVIVETLTLAASGPLRQVADTPRLYRRTNRASPTTHQPYIATAATTLTTFAKENMGKVESQLMTQWLTQVCTDVSEQYRTLTYDVLSSVHKMEESLKRLKRARDRGTQAGGEVTGGLSDDDKIRLQICLDVEYFGEQLRCLSLNVELVAPFTALLTMTHNARDGKFTP
ncbi:hypothetical protein Pmani_017456 [Petrolisthes manimaculis]|uniref:Conserved oligomeric Golgi complex subunit 2 n=1 Tax=Petrolisthes manimaculis TaxID=1843537 RepID=A0AAE1PQ27_9EUCA|nr:hypothetical protein Pmani_017456 [Petrolisthes manimaculis]